MSTAPERNSRDRVLGAWILLGAVLFAVLTVGLRAGPLAEPAPTPVPTATPLPTAPPPSPTPVPVETVVPPPSPASGAAGRTVCIDPGHGGADLGNVRLDENGQLLLQEKDFTLPHSLMLADRLRAAGIEVVMTRTTDTEVNPDNGDVNNDGTVAPAGGEARSNQLDDLQARINICNQAGADILVSVHYNGAENAFLQGYEVWYNGDRPFSENSALLARLMHTELGNQYAAAGYDAFDKGIGIEAHALTGPARPGSLVPSEMPGIIVEGLFLSNDDDAAFIVTDAAAPALVTAYEQAIRNYFAELAG
ncbi:MAG: N-acetylmuramoyl-L-alanine amidase [Chloroflexota bacterium]|nr:N-acetylmuramoyl-L-alanine amidase [Chloroflexota bacterium]